MDFVGWIEVHLVSIKLVEPFSRGKIKENHFTQTHGVNAKTSSDDLRTKACVHIIRAQTVDLSVISRRHPFSMIRVRMSEVSLVEWQFLRTPTGLKLEFELNLVSCGLILPFEEQFPVYRHF